jgi:nitrous oxidase accessory protein NosD
MRRRVVLVLAATALTLLLASGVALAVGIGSAAAQRSVVGPGESIQKAVNAADPGDTIVVRGVHREDVVIRKNGIKLRGVGNAVIEAPTRAKADSPCSKTFGPEAICVLGDVNIKTGKLTGQRVSDVSVSGFTIRGFKIEGDGARVIDVIAARNATVVGNRVIGNVPGGIVVFRNVNSTIAKNHFIGSSETKADGILVEISSRTTVVKNVVRSYPEDTNAIEVTEGIDTTIAGNDLIGNLVGVFVEGSTATKILSNDITDSTLVGTVILDSTGTKIVSNDIRRSGDTGIAIFGPARANTDAKVVGNRISGGPWGIYVERAHGGSFTGNQVHDNCAGMFFEAFKAEPVGGFEVKGNTVTHNTRSCRAAQFDRNFSGIGIALLGASDMEVKGNHLSGNVPSGPTPVSGGVVVSTNPFVGGTTKPTNNSVIGNHFGRNKPDIFWDESGSGNRFLGNLCNSSVPSRLCN